MSGTKTTAAPVSGHPDAPQAPCISRPWSPASDLVDLSALEDLLAAIDLDELLGPDLDLDALLGPDLDLDELLGPDLDLDSLLGGGGGDKV